MNPVAKQTAGGDPQYVRAPLLHGLGWLVKPLFPAAYGRPFYSHGLRQFGLAPLLPGTLIHSQPGRFQSAREIG